IKIFTGAVVSFEEMQSRLAVIRRLCAARDGRGLLLELKDLVPDYNPSKQVLRKLLADPHSPQAIPASLRYDRNDQMAATGVPNLDAGSLACENEKSA
ncbi:MAG: hypothetical protein ABSG25_13895, partial [Bryobacteraceae bacterium]